MSNYLSLHKKHFDLRRFIEEAIHEDLGDGDHSSNSTVPLHHQCKMFLKVKESGILAGVEAASVILKQIDPKIRMKILIKDGSKVNLGDIAFELKGNSRKLLLAERLILNVMQRMSGIATHTAALQALCAGTKTKVIDTRKTTPGFRFFEKWAVVIGGGANHRFGLYDMILIKDNHVDLAGGITKAIDAANFYLKKNHKKIPVEVETRSLSDVQKVVKHGNIKRIMLDNFTPVQTKRAVDLIKNKFEVESSGGITSRNIRKYAECGVDYISVGALTHHVKSLDLSLKVVF